MKKIAKIFKTLLVTLLLGVGVNAWADDYSVVWQNNFDDASTYQDGWVGVKSRSAATNTVAQKERTGEEKYISFSNSAYNTVWTYTLSTVSTISEAADYIFEMDFALTRCNTDGNTILQILNADNNEMFKVMAVGGDTGRGSTTLVTGSVYTNETVQTETVTMNTFRGGELTWYNIIISSNATNGTDLTLTKCSDATETKTYHLSDDFVGLGKIILDPANVNNTKYGGGAFDNFVFKTPKVAGFVAAPTYTITGAYNTNRKFTLECITEGATIYYADSDIEKGATGWVTYTGEAITAEETIYAYAEDGDGNTSEKINFETGAGSIITLSNATLSHTAANQYTISNSQAGILGTPTATVHYQIDGGAEQTSTETAVNVEIAANGILSYWLTADGYGATEPINAEVYAYTTYAIVNTVDLCTSNSNDWSIKGDEVSVSGDEDRTYYQYKDQNGTIVGDGLFAATFSNDGSTWRIQRYYGGTKNQNSAESIALLALKKGQIVQVNSSASAVSTTNLTVIDGNTFTGTQSYSVVNDGDVTLHYAKDATITKVYVCQDNITPSIGSTGYATFASDYALDFSAATGVKAYYASAVEGGKVIMSKVNGAVAVGTGLFLQKTEGEISIPVAANGDELSTNLFVRGGDAAVTKADGYDQYVLGASGESVAFFLINGDAPTVAKDKAYLKVPTGAGTRLSIVFGDEDTTGIQTVEKTVNDNVVYDLQGRRVAAPQKGLYIVNGKKVIK
jgi:hypothetical protein